MKIEWIVSLKNETSVGLSAFFFSGVVIERAQQMTVDTRPPFRFIK
jgi:hypothetical protein